VTESLIEILTEERQWRRMMELCHESLALAEMRAHDLKLAQAEIRYWRAKVSKLEKENGK
jgi:hypothetical protein